MLKISIFFLLFTGYLYAAEPFIELKSFPSKGELETISDNEELFANKLLEYYRYSSVYVSQLKSMGLNPKVTLIEPSLEDFSDGDIALLKKYYKTAQILEGQIKSSPEAFYNAKYSELKSKYKISEKELFMLRDSIYWMGLENEKLNYYKVRFPSLLTELDSLRFRNDSLLMAYNKKLWKHDDKLRSIYMQSTYKKPFISGGMTINQFYFKDENMESDMSGGVFVNISPESILGFGKYFDLWTEYQFPRWKSKYSLTMNPNNFVKEFSTNIYDLGLSLNLPLSEIFKIKSFMMNIRLGGGLFWGNSRIYNSNLPKSDWDGYLVKVDVNLVNYSHIFPVGVTVGMNFYNFNKNLAFNQYDGYFNLGKISLSNLYFGLQFPLVSSIYLMR